MFNFYFYFYFYFILNVKVLFLLINISQIYLLHFTILIFIIFYYLTFMKIIFMLSFILHGLSLFLILLSNRFMNYFLIILVCKIGSHLELLHHLLALILCIERSSLPRRSAVISMLS